MAKIKFTVSDVFKKHLKIVGYLSVSAALGYVLSLLTNRPEAVYLTPLINYIIYSLKLELGKEGYAEAIRNK